VAALIHAESPDNVLFTASATEAANLAIKGVAWARPRRGDHIVLTGIEHPAVIRAVEFLEQHGFTATRVPVDRVGRVNPADVRVAVTDRTILICVHHVNHDIGTIEPVAEIGEIAAAWGIPLFVDAVASGGWLPIDVQALKVSLLSLSPHRFYGPKGVGILYRHRRARLASLIHGGAQEGGLRAGTENVPAIVGAGVAAAFAERELPTRAAQTAQLQRRLLKGLRSRLEHLHLNGPEPGPGRSSINLNLSVEFVEGEGLTLALDMQGIAIHSGPACVTGSLKIPPVLAAIGLPPALAQASVTLSPGKDNTADEIDEAVETFAATVKKLRAMSPTWEEFQRGRADSLTGPQTGRST
jgi:cysteine desulfurase